jgi:hypothetical protein
MVVVVVVVVVVLVVVVVVVVDIGRGSTMPRSIVSPPGL